MKSHNTWFYLCKCGLGRWSVWWGENWDMRPQVSCPRLPEGRDMYEWFLVISEAMSAAVQTPCLPILKSSPSCLIFPDPPIGSNRWASHRLLLHFSRCWDKVRRSGKSTVWSVCALEQVASLLWTKGYWSGNKDNNPYSSVGYKEQRWCIKVTEHSSDPISELVLHFSPDHFRLFPSQLCWGIIDIQ